MPKLSDPWFEAQFYGEANAAGFRFLTSIEGAQGLWLWCPCGFSDPRYRADGGGRPHAIMVPFANPRNAPQLPADHGPFSKTMGTHPRWTMIGSSLDDLTTTPSVDVGGGADGASCWHGFITNGEVLGC